MKVIYLSGGLGNQMFQYACARARAGNSKIILNIHNVQYPRKGDTKRSFQLDHFLIHNVGIQQKPEPVWHRIYTKCRRRISAQYGYFQSEKFFKEKKESIRQEFTLKKPLHIAAQAYADKISNTPISIALHIRRGDYVTNAHTYAYHGTCSIDYYTQALETLSKKINSPFELFIFSDDIPWVKTHMHFQHPTHFVSDVNIFDYEELILMSRCNHQIISNSTFSWWAAWLNNNPGKIVIAPEKWFADPNKKSDIIPATWIKL